VPPGLADVVAISGNGTHCLALTGSGTVIAWGSNDCGECEVPSWLAAVTAVAAGYGHSLAVVSQAGGYG
jgi:alpha-tubulin suppressor-like RCC1 family protein